MQPETDVHGIALAEAVGFEPTVGYTPTAVFKTAALNLSATLPEINLASLLNLVLLLVIRDRFFGRVGSVVVQKLIQGNQARRSQKSLVKGATIHLHFRSYQCGRSVRIEPTNFR